MAPRSFHARGKLLLAGEYAVLDGALGLALPTKPGQQLVFYPNPQASTLHWESLTKEGACWLSACWSSQTLKQIEGEENAASERLTKMLHFLRDQVGLLPTFFAGKVVTRLEFPAPWGLGSSSSLVALLAQWSGVNPYALQAHVFGGSGYDVAAAMASKPLLYRILPESPMQPEVVPVSFCPPFVDQMLFVYSGRKQDSREGIAAYRKKPFAPDYLVQISSIARKMTVANKREDFEELMREHEDLTARHLGLPAVQEKYFPDFPGQIKSLGAWGGDFLLAVSRRPQEEIRQYFLRRGMPELIPFRNLIHFD